MHSMAQIMTAVGTIVSKPEKKKYKSVLKKHARRKHGGEYIAPFEVPHAAPGSPTVWRGPGHGGYSDYAPHPHAGHTAPASQHPHAASAADASSKHYHRSSNSRPHSAPFSPAAVPRTRAAMIDMIMAKLHDIETAEQDTAAFLAHSSRHHQSEGMYTASHVDESNDAIDRHLQGVRVLDVTQLASNTSAAPRGPHREDDSSVAVEAQSELDISANFLHYPSEAAQQKRDVATSEQGTQDSAHTLENLDGYLQQAQRLAAQQPSVSALEQQEQLRISAPAPRLTAEQLRAKERAYLDSLPKVPRNPRTEESLHAYMRELDR
jgi:hypothetical protein